MTEIAARPDWNEESLFDLTAADLIAQHPRVRHSTVQTFIERLSRARRAPLVNVLSGLLATPTGFVDRAVVWDVCNAFGSVDALLRADQAAVMATLEPKRDHDRRQIENLAHIARWFEVDWHRTVLERWRAAGVEMNHPEGGQGLRGKTIGLLSGLVPRDFKAIDMLKREGGRVRRLPTWRKELDLDGLHAVVSSGPGLPTRTDVPAHLPVILFDDLSAWIKQEQQVADSHSKFGSVPSPQHEEAAATWESILHAHPHHMTFGQRGKLPLRSTLGLQAGALYLYTPEAGQIVIVVADSLKGAIDGLEGGEDEIVFDRTRAVWVAGSRQEIRSTSPVLRSGLSALQAGRPILVRRREDWHKVPHEAGVYRIHRRAANGRREVYVGRSQDLRRRPFRHEKTAGLPWSDGSSSGIIRIEIIPVKGRHRFEVWTVTDLDEAEATHIARMQKRYSQDPTTEILNITGGRNGPPSRPRTSIYVWKAAGTTDDPNPLPPPREELRPCPGG